VTALPAVVDNEAARRFEAVVDGQVAELVYRRNGDRFTIVHTGVPDELEGRGLGGALVRTAVDHAAAHGWTVVPQCPFARRWLREHPDVAGRVAIDWPVARS
jgi:predicted GNAT family acetyltransferase